MGRATNTAKAKTPKAATVAKKVRGPSMAARRQAVMEAMRSTPEARAVESARRSVSMYSPPPNDGIGDVIRRAINYRSPGGAILETELDKLSGANGTGYSAAADRLKKAEAALQRATEAALKDAGVKAPKSPRVIAPKLEPHVNAIFRAGADPEKLAAARAALEKAKLPTKDLAAIAKRVTYSPVPKGVSPLQHIAAHNQKYVEAVRATQKVLTQPTAAPSMGLVAPAAIAVAALAGFENARQKAKAEGADNATALKRGAGGAVVSGGIATGATMAVNKAMQLMAKASPAVAKTAGRLVPGALLALASYEAYKGYQQDGLRGASTAVADFATMGLFSLAKNALGGKAKPPEAAVPVGVATAAALDLAKAETARAQKAAVDKARDAFGAMKAEDREIAQRAFKATVDHVAPGRADATSQQQMRRELAVANATSGREWVDPFTRADGTNVRGHFRDRGR